MMVVNNSSDANDHFVLFADLLGSGQAIESDPRFLTYYYGNLYGGESSVRHDDPHSPLQSARIVYAYSRFHEAVRDLLDHFVADFWGFHTLITFSDSVVLVASSDHLADYARWLMQRCIQRRVAVRMGLGKGSFAVGRFASETTPRRQYYSNQFIGSAVVRAYWAESSGAKGMRILVHPSAVEPLTEAKRANQPRLHLMALPEGEAKTRRATHELCYIRQRDDGPNMDSDPLWPNMEPYDVLVGNIEAMQAQQPTEAHSHYAATAAALSRMVTQAG